MFTETQLAFLKEKHYAIFAAINDNSGYPHLAPVWIGEYQNKLYVITTDKSARYRYIGNGSQKVGINVLPAAGYPYLSVVGDATIKYKHNFDNFEKIVGMMVGKYVETGDVEERIAKIMETDDRIIIEISPSRVFGQVK